MGYSQVKGRKPFERASKIAHSEVLKNPDVIEFVEQCSPPSIPDYAALKTLQQPIPSATRRIKTVIAVDGGMTEVAVTSQFPSAGLAYMTFGPLMLALEELATLDRQVFIAPEDMAKLKELQRYSLPLPIRGIKAPGAASFAGGVRHTIHRFLFEKKPELGAALAWLLFREWLPDAERQPWRIPKCPAGCGHPGTEFRTGQLTSVSCANCGAAVYLADGLRLYERIDEDQGAGGIMSYLLTTLEQLVIVHVLKTLLEMKPSVLREVLFVKDGPLAFFGVVAPLHKPMQELMHFLSTKDNGNPLVCMIGLEKSGAFVEHATAIDELLQPNHYLLLTNDYIYKYITPGDPAGIPFGKNTYFGAKLIFKSSRGDTYVATIPTAAFASEPKFEHLLNAADVLSVTAELRCSMYDHALVPIVLANKLVSLADVPSSDILLRFTKARLAANG